MWRLVRSTRATGFRRVGGLAAGVKHAGTHLLGPAMTTATATATGNYALRRYSNHNLGGKSLTNGTQIPQEILDLPLQQYHEESDIFLEELFDELEELSELYAKQIPELEYSHGVLTLTVEDVGTYVINKQPPNKQIWLASPESGPNRFDLYKGQWISLRDGKTLLEVLNKELHEALPKDADFNIVK